MNVTLLSCSPAPGVPACGKWSFETGNDNEGWGLVASSTQAGSSESIATAPASGHGRALAIPFATDESGRSTVEVVGKVCPGGGVASESGYSFKADLYVQSSASGSNGPFFMAAYNGADNVGSTGDKGIFFNQWQTFSIPADTYSLVFTDLRISISFSGVVTGTIYLDNLRVE
jgi:hypothetical protein